jgi:hypothetical protein
LFINLLILAGILLIAKQVTSAWQTYEQENNLERIVKTPDRSQEAQAREDAVSPPEAGRPYPEFMVVGEKDLFLPDRRPLPPEPQNAVVEKPPALPKKPSLNGVFSTGGKRQAMITVYENAQSRGQSRFVNVGDNVQGYTVGEINDTTLKLRWKDQEELIDMLDAAPQQASAVPAAVQAQVTVITIGAAVAAVDTSRPADAPGGPEDRRGSDTVVTGGQGGAVGRTAPAARQPGGASRSSRGAPMSDRGTFSTAPSGVLGFPGAGSAVPFSNAVQPPQNP